MKGTPQQYKGVSELVLELSVKSGTKFLLASTYKLLCVFSFVWLH